MANSHVAPVTLLICSIVAALASVLGDIPTQSMFKREAGIKDSGHFIPGHGGILDRIDSLTAAVPVRLLVVTGIQDALTEGNMLTFLWDLASFIVALGVLITVHEFGHFWVARRCGVRVERFSIGFGKALWRRTDKLGTEYVIALILRAVMSKTRMSAQNRLFPAVATMPSIINLLANERRLLPQVRLQTSFLLS